MGDGGQHKMGDGGQHKSCTIALGNLNWLPLDADLFSKCLVHVLLTDCSSSPVSVAWSPFMKVCCSVFLSSSLLFNLSYATV